MLARKLDTEEKSAYTVRSVLYSGAIELQRAHIGTASLDARILLQHVLRINREDLLADDARKLDLEQYAAYQQLIEQRLKRKPVSQLIGKREFFGREFLVTENTLDPRADSETLIEAVLARYPDRKKRLRIADLGTGTGCLLLTLLAEYNDASGVGIDASELALQVAHSNAETLGLKDRVSFLQSYWCEKIEDFGEKFDIVIANPPYIATGDIESLELEVSRYEPRLALDGGVDGMDCYREIFPQLTHILKPEGCAVFEIGMGQENDVVEIAGRSSLQVIGMKQDLSGITRCVLIQTTTNNG